jgi:alpha-galactosidase
MRPTKLAVIGAGSLDFGPGILADVLGNPEFAGSTLSLVDTDPESLELMAAVARRLREAWGVEVQLEATTDQREVLPGAEFVLVVAEVQRARRWYMDYQIPLRHGLRQPLGENGGPGGFAHAARNIPIVLSICRAMRELCPEAWFLNFNNPVPRLTLAAHKYGGVKAAGFCHGIGIAVSNISGLLDMEAEDIDLKAAGINHFTWVLDARRKSTGEDLYPAIRARCADWPKDWLPLTRELLTEFGYFPVCGDTHFAEYLPWVSDASLKPWERYALETPAWLTAPEPPGTEERQARLAHLRSLAAGEASLGDLGEGSGERAVPTIVEMVKDCNAYELAINLPNAGNIANLPDGAIVEIPAVVSGRGIQGLTMGPLPEPIGELCRRQATIADLAVQAAVTGDRRAALHALLLDPMVTDIDQARGILEDYLREHADLLPQFSPRP